MDKTLAFFAKLTRLFLSAAEVSLSLVAFILVVYLLLGEASGRYVIAVVANVSLLVDAISAQAIVGVALAFAIVGVFRKR